MCLITILPPDVELTLAQVKDAMSKNADGVGIMFSLDGGLYTGRTLTRSPVKAHRWLKNNPSHVERIVHFRKATAGDVSRANLHPFEIHGRFGLMHNGTLPHSIAPTYLKDKRSDTAVFVEDLLSSIPSDALALGAVWSLIDAAVEENRVVMLDGETGELQWTADDMWTVGINDIVLSNTYSLDDAKLWGVKKTTFNSFHGYVSYANYNLTPAKPAAAAPAPSTTYTPGPVSPKKEASHDDVLKSTYVTYQGSERIPCSGRAVDHPWYGLASTMLKALELKSSVIAPSTLLIALIHAQLTEDEMKSLTPDRCRAVIDTLLTFTKASTAPVFDLIANFKDSKCLSTTPSSTTMQSATSKCGSTSAGQL